MCLASRHYLQITIRKSMSIDLETQTEHEHDINLYIHSHIVGDDCPGTRALRHEVLRRSAGVFLWVVLVVRTLRELYDQGQNLYRMWQKLEETPPDLYHLFTDIFSRDHSDLKECNTLCRWGAVCTEASSFCRALRRHGDRLTYK